MAAPKGNKHNEKWTYEESIDFLQRVSDYVVEHKECRSLSEAAVECDGYEELISYVINKHSIDFKPIKKAKDIVKNRLVKQGLEGDVNNSMAIFILKNNHGMTDKTENTHNIKTEQPLFGE
jgi:hypothetical protein